MKLANELGHSFFISNLLLLMPLPRILWGTFKHSFVTPNPWAEKSLFLLLLPKSIAMRDTVHETDKTSLKVPGI